MSQIPGVLFASRNSNGVEVNEDTAMSLSAVFAAVNKLSSITAALPLSVYRKNGESREVADTLRTNYLLHTEFNPSMSAFIARRTVEFHRLLWGNGYTEIQWDGAGRPLWLWPVAPWRVQVKWDDDSEEQYYLIDGKREIEPRDILHETLISTDGICGKSWIEFAFTSLGLSISAQEFSEKFFTNGARPGVILEHEGVPKPEQRKEMKESWEQAHSGPANAHKTAVVWGGWKVSEHGGSLSPMDSQLIEARRFSTEEVSRWLNVPPHILYDLSRSTNNNIEHQGIEFVQHSLGPTLVLKEQEIDRKLLKPPTLYSKHNVTALLRGDSAARREYYKGLIGIGMMNVNEARALEEMNPIGPDGDVYFVPVNMQPIDRAINPPEPPTPLPTPNNPSPEESPTSDDNAPAMRAALHSLLADTFGRLMRKELNEGRRAAKKPDDFLSWLDSFYPEFEVTLTQSLQSPVGIAAAWDIPVDSAAMAKAYCQRSRESLLDVAGSATPKELPAAVEREFIRWEATRANDEASRLLGDSK